MRSVASARVVRAVALSAAVITLCWLAGARRAAAQAAAEHRGLGLNWVRLSGAETCLTGAQLMNRLEAHFDRVLFVRSGEAELSIDGYVYPVDVPEGWALTLEVSDAQGTVHGHRDLGVLPGRDCSVVADTAELILDLTVDPDNTLGTGLPLPPALQKVFDDLFRDDPFELEPPPLKARTPGPKASAAAAATPPGQTSDPQEPPAAVERVDDGEGARFDVALAGGLGLQPGVALGVGVHAVLPTRIGWLVELSVLAFPQRRAGTGAQRADFQLQAGALGLCPWQPFDGLALCAGAQYGNQRVEPSALGQAQPASAPGFDLLGYAALRLPLFGSLFAQARAGAVLPLIRTEFRYLHPRGERTLYRTPGLAGRAELGLGLQL